MTNCLDRTEGQGIPRDEFFMHNKSSSLMGSSSLCITTLGNAVLTEKCKDPLRNQNDLSECNKLIKNELKKSDELGITSGFILLNQECSESNSFKVCQSSLSNCLKAGDLNLKSVPCDSTAIPSLYTDKSDSFTLSSSHTEPNRTFTNETSGKLLSDKITTDVKSTPNDFKTDRSEQVIVLLSDDSNCSVAHMVSNEVKHLSSIENVKSDLIRIYSDSEPNKAMKKLTSISSSEINLPSTEDYIEVSGDESSEKEMAESFSVSANSDQDFDNSNSCQQASDEQLEICSNVSKTINMEDIRMDDTAESDKSKSNDGQETVSVLAHLKSEIIDVKPDIIDLSMYSDDDNDEYTANSPVYENINIKQEIIETESNEGVYYTESIDKDDSNTEYEFPNQDSFDGHSLKVKDINSDKDVISNDEQNECNVISQTFEGILMNTMENDKLSKEVLKNSEAEIVPVQADPLETVSTKPDLMESDLMELDLKESVPIEPGLKESVSGETVLMEPIIMKRVSIEPGLKESVLEEPVLMEHIKMKPVSIELGLKESVLEEPVIMKPILTKPVLIEPILIEPDLESVSIEPILIESVLMETGPKESISMESSPKELVSMEPVPKESVSMEIVPKESIFLDTVSKELVSIERVSMESVSNVDKSEKSTLPVKLKNSRCTIQLVPKGHGKLLGERRRNCLNIEDDNWNNDSESGLAERLETLTGTVKIGCLSVTPLLPCTKNETKEQIKEESESETKATDNIVHNSDDLGNKEPDINKDSSDQKRTINIFLKNENLLKNNVDITISPKGSESGVDALETLKVKIPQLIESFTSNAPSEKSPSPMQEPNKNFIVNKNLKIIESFLMQKGFQKEANILKEKTEIIKPYLEDIALKMEKTINERRSGHIRSDVKEPSTTEFNKLMNDYGRRSDTGKSERAVEKEFSSLTEKFLHNSAVKSRPKRYEDYLSQVFFPPGHPNSGEKTRMYDRYYGKSYYEGLDYLMSRDQGGYPGRGMEPCMNKVYRSSRHDMRECDYTGIPDMSMYDQFLPEFDNKVHPSTLVGKSNTFSHSDFSQFIDEYTAEKYNNFIHFMVPDMEAVAFDMMESRMWKESELNFPAGNPPMNCCVPMPQFYPTGPYQYPMMTQSSMQMIPQPHISPHLMHHQMNPVMGRHLQVESSRENCGQLTITPLDDCGKPYGPVPLSSDPCSQGYCNEPYPCSQSFPPGILPPVPPLVPTDSLSQQLTITPLHQSSNLPYLHRSADSASRRRGRPPLDPEYAAVGFRKDAFANARFSRADFMARVQNNVDSSYLDPRCMRFGKIPGDVGGMESRPVKQGVSISSVVETEVLASPVVPPVASMQPTIAPPSIETTVSTTPVVMKLGETPVKSPNPVNPSVPLNPPIPVTPPIPILTSMSTLAPAPGTAILLSNGFKRIEPRVEKPKPRFVEIAPKPTAIPEPVVPKPKPSFQVLSKQVKISAEKFLTSSSVKISLVEKRSPIPDTSSNTPVVSITKTSCREEQVTTPEKISPSKKVTPEKIITHGKIISPEKIITSQKITPEKIITPEKNITHKNITPENTRPPKEISTNKISPEKVTCEKSMNPKTQKNYNSGSNSELSGNCKNIQEKLLGTSFKNTMITLKAAQMSTSLVKKDNVELKIENTKNKSKKESEISLNSQNIDKAMKSATKQAINNKISLNKELSSTQIKQVEFDNSSSNSIIIIDSETDKTLDSDELGFTKNLSVKAKKRRRIPQFKKKKKRGKPIKPPTEIQNKVVMPHKVVVEKPIVKTNEKSNARKLNVSKFNEENSLSNSNSCSSANNKESGRSESMESPDQSIDGVRRSGRKRKIIEGNPKFRDMERVDLKYFREERIKSTPAKRKLDSKVCKPEVVVKKRKNKTTKEPIKMEKLIKTMNPIKTLNPIKTINTIKTMSPIKTMNPIKIMNPIKTSNPINRNNEKVGRPNESNTKEKLQQFLDVNDIYLKPQTFI